MKLLVLDVEGTLFQTKLLPGTTIPSTIWQGIAEELGPDAVSEEVRTHERQRNGEYASYLDWMVDTIKIHQKYGLTQEVFRRVVDQAKYSQGVSEFFARLDRPSYRPVLVSGGFRALAVRAQRDLRIPHAFSACDYLFDAQGVLDFYNVVPCDFHAKLDFVKLMLRELRLADDGWIFVGDGPNDIPLAREAPISIGYRSHPDLATVVTHTIEHFRDLDSLLEAS